MTLAISHGRVDGRRAPVVLTVAKDDVPPAAAHHGRPARIAQAFVAEAGAADGPQPVLGVRPLRRLEALQDGALHPAEATAHAGLLSVLRIYVHRLIDTRAPATAVGHVSRCNASAERSSGDQAAPLGGQRVVDAGHAAPTPAMRVAGPLGLVVISDEPALGNR